MFDWTCDSKLHQHEVYNAVAKIQGRHILNYKVKVERNWNM